MTTRTRPYVYRCTCLLWAAWRPGTNLAREFLHWHDAITYATGRNKDRQQIRARRAAA